jgi:hypothetical protein
MLAMRARGFALRDACADLLQGVWLAEEAQDITDLTVVTESTDPALQPAAPTDPRIADLAGKLKWTRARLELEMQAAKGDVEELVARMEEQLPEEEAPPAPVPDAGKILKMTAKQRSLLFALLNDLDIKSKRHRLGFAEVCGIDVESYSDLTIEDANHLIDEAQKRVDAAKFVAENKPYVPDPAQVAAEQQAGKTPEEVQDELGF